MHADNRAGIKTAHMSAGTLYFKVAIVYCTK